MSNNKQFLSIGEAAQYLGVSIMTLRRWHKTGKFMATFLSPGQRLYYSMADLQKKTKGIVRAAHDWASIETPETPPEEWHCATSDVFKARLERMTIELFARPGLADRASLIASAAGEIGNNSYDHNLGSWPDITGVLFTYDLTEHVIVLADRGVGMLATLRRVRPQLTSHQEALKVAFTQIITGRSPEHRGNGLKYVRQAILQSRANLRFWSGDAYLTINKIANEPKTTLSNITIRGCIAVIKF